MEEYISLEEIKGKLKEALKGQHTFEKFINGEHITVLYLNDVGFFNIIFKKSYDEAMGNLFIMSVVMKLKGDFGDSSVVCKDIYLEV